MYSAGELKYPLYFNDESGQYLGCFLCRGRLIVPVMNYRFCIPYNRSKHLVALSGVWQNHHNRYAGIALDVLQC